jgi:hypothetical protein
MDTYAEPVEYLEYLERWYSRVGIAMSFGRLVVRFIRLSHPGPCKVRVLALALLPSRNSHPTRSTRGNQKLHGLIFFFFFVWRGLAGLAMYDDAAYRAFLFSFSAACSFRVSCYAMQGGTASRRS